MSDKAERWLAEQEIELLKRIYERESPPEREDRSVVRLDPQRVRVFKS